MLRDNRLSAGHARALITAPDPTALAHQVIKRGLSVRQTEKLAKAGPKEPPKPKPVKSAGDKDADTRALEGDLSAALGMKVQIDHKAVQQSGFLTIRYESLEDLDTLCRVLTNG